LSTYWLSLLGIGCAAATLAYWIARRIQVMALVDVVWSAGLGLAALGYWYTLAEPTLRSGVVLGVLLLWSSRLSVYLLQHRVLPRKEDPRYAYLTAHWGERALRNYYPLFLAQIFLVALFIIPVGAAMQAPGSWGWSDWLGLAIALCSLAGESVADRQLSAFRAEAANRGQVCQQGVWRYSRHPNYFFEWLHWWAYVAFALCASHWPVALLGPLSMFIFLRFITGVPYAERSSLRSRGVPYRRYQQTTNTFFPWKPHH
jgi:steroid 5-alpha reductase family enzyme